MPPAVRCDVAVPAKTVKVKARAPLAYADVREGRNSAKKSTAAKSAQAAPYRKGALGPRCVHKRPAMALATNNMIPFMVWNKPNVVPCISCGARSATYAFAIPSVLAA